LDRFAAALSGSHVNVRPTPRPLGRIRGVASDPSGYARVPKIGKVGAGVRRRDKARYAARGVPHEALDLERRRVEAG
jgi:hypothetical protein